MKGGLDFLSLKIETIVECRQQALQKGLLHQPSREPDSPKIQALWRRGLLLFVKPLKKEGGPRATGLASSSSLPLVLFL